MSAPVHWKVCHLVNTLDSTVFFKNKLAACIQILRTNTVAAAYYPVWLIGRLGLSSQRKAQMFIYIKGCKLKLTSSINKYWHHFITDIKIRKAHNPQCVSP